MHAVVIFDSMFGNTRQIAEAIAEGIAPLGQVELVPAATAGSSISADVDLVIAGGPTHGHGMSNRNSRRVSADQLAKGAQPADRGLREWCEALAPPASSVATATFDTRYERPKWVTGSAAGRAAKALRKRGYRSVAKPESFFVDRATGPLKPGERERARLWGEHLAATATQPR